jgi:maltose alpha-D-glucosyltransferase / alpha-amylase
MIGLLNFNNNICIMDRIKEYWSILYGDSNDCMVESFIEFLDKSKSKINSSFNDKEWYSNAVVYSLYVDLFNENFDGLQEKLPYLKDLGVTCLWLLPVLESPMRDAGFDISDYRKIRSELFSRNYSDSERELKFREFLDEAHNKGLKIIFDIAINHTSNQHYWFQEAIENPESKYRDYYIWSDDDKKYSDARIIFKGMLNSNWEKSGNQYYFHRFFEFQPDLNYKNPEVLLEMSKNLVYWIHQGVDGFRADAIPYLWKEEGTDCENLPKTHIVVKFFRAVIDYIKPGTLLLAEACQKPKEVVKYMGDGDECHAGYHFPLMPQIFKSIAAHSGNPIKYILSEDITPKIPETCQWFTFLRCHDELSLELVYVSEQDRSYIHSSYCHNPEWDFREGEGISARLSELMLNNPKKILLAYSIMLSLPGTPVIYYGDEFAKRNDVDYYKNMIKHTGHDDTRFLVRGKLDWKYVDEKIGESGSTENKVFFGIKKMLEIRNNLKLFGKADIEWIDADKSVFAYIRYNDNEKVLIVNNLGDSEAILKFNDKLNLRCLFEDILYKNVIELSVPANKFMWFLYD